MVKRWSAAIFKIHMKVFCLVELRGLEPLTPCLQNSADVSRTVPDVGLIISLDHLRSARFGAVATDGGYRPGQSSDPAIPPAPAS